MIDFDALAEETCSGFLSMACLKKICLTRGFSPPGGGKDALARFVAPRLLETTGAARAAATLEPTWVLTLHAIAMAKEPPDLRDLLDVLHPGARAWDVDFRSEFKKMADGLLSRGLVLIQDRPAWSSRYGSRFARLLFHLPDDHRASLPPYPIETQQLGDTPHGGDPASFCRSVLQAACQGDTQGKDLRSRVASALVLGKGGIRLGTHRIADLADFALQSRRVWAAGSTGKKATSRAGPTTVGPLDAVSHILAHLPSGEGVSASALGTALSRIDLKPPPKKVLATFLEDGVDAGFLVRGGPSTARIYRAPDGDSLEAGSLEEASLEEGSAPSGDSPLAFRAIDGGIRVDLDTTDLDALFALAEVCRAAPREGRLELVPDEVLLGRRAKTLKSMSALGAVRAVSPAFEHAAARAEARHGTLLLHEGLLILRVEDLGLRTVLEHALGSSLRPIQGAFLAVPRDLQGKIEALAAKEGFTPRRVS